MAGLFVAALVVLLRRGGALFVKSLLFAGISGWRIRI
jgi:hypothetical protein